MKFPAKLLFGLLLGLPAVCVADPGNVLSWYSNSLNELTFTCATAVVKLDLLDPNVVRVRMEPSGTAFNTNASFTVVKNWVLPSIAVVDGNPLTITTAGLRVNVSKTPFRLTFAQTNGVVWLTDTNTTGFTSTPSGAVTNLSETFVMSSGEQFYGLGLVLGQPLSYRGQSRTLYNARTGFQSGDMTDMAVPLMLSSKGYGLFVDNTFPKPGTLRLPRNGVRWLALANLTITSSAPTTPPTRFIGTRKSRARPRCLPGGRWPTCNHAMATAIGRRCTARSIHFAPTTCLATR